MSSATSNKSVRVIGPGVHPGYARQEQISGMYHPAMTNSTSLWKHQYFFRLRHDSLKLYFQWNIAGSILKATKYNHVSVQMFVSTSFKEKNRCDIISRCNKSAVTNCCSVLYLFPMNMQNISNKDWELISTRHYSKLKYKE